MDERTTLAVLSDHGFALGTLPDDPTRTRDLRRVSERFHRLEGILYLYGAGVKRGAAIDRPRILDVTPTLLALAGLSPARDMHGRVLAEALTLPAEPARIATYEKGRKDQERTAGREEKTDRALMEHLRSLGYLDARSPAGDRNLAAVLFREGRLRESVSLYEKLVKEKPDDPTLRTSLAGVLGSLGRYAEAREHLEKGLALDPLNPEGRHNLGVIHEREGRQEDAVAEYRNALRCAPGYEPSRKALLRLTGSDAADAPRTDAERRAFALAEEAAQAARRGDYQRARRLLAEAARLAPGYALVHQYRSNVAYLEGDHPGAVAALERALALQPDNVLYRENLERLRARAAAGAGPAGSGSPPTPRGPSRPHRQGTVNPGRISTAPAPHAGGRPRPPPVFEPPPRAGLSAPRAGLSSSPARPSL
jgi:tetratricopeptide (TPR) repeat protein